MGGIWFNPGVLHGHVSEIVGFKSGLALTNEQFVAHISDHPYYLGAWQANSDSVIRLRSEEFEQLIVILLHAVGVLRTADPTSGFLHLLKRHMKNPAAMDIHTDAVRRWTRHVRAMMEEYPDNTPATPKAWDPTPFVEEMKVAHGIEGVRIALELVDAVAFDQLKSPFRVGRLHEWSDVQELKDLFESEKLGGEFGRFLDQRFIDYLAANFDRIDEMHWRKFEGLVGEFFERHGYFVELGPGRNDGGVDARIWSDASDRPGPPLLLVQCKREQNKISKTVVKALWADVVHEQALSGLIVTTSALSPGAKKTCDARNYPVGAAERRHLQDWLARLRTPGTGVFMAR